MTSTIELDPSEEHQTIEGFGASGAWWAQDVGGWEEEVRDRVIRLLFDHDEGIGLSVYRYNIGAGSGKEIRDPWRRTETFEVTPGVYDWTRDRNAIWVAKAAHAAGVERFVAFANSPPAHMTRSGLVSGAATDDRGGWVDLRVWMGDLLSTLTGLELNPRHTRSNLRPDMVDAFARYLVDIVRHLREVEGIPVGWISPINEPQWAWCRGNQHEGCHYTPSECVAVAKALVRAGQQSGLDVRVSVVESGSWMGSGIHMRRLLGDPELAPHLDHFCLHSYQSGRRAKRTTARRAGRRYPHVRLWMSEWVETRHGASADMGSALTLANTIHEDLTLGGVTSWQYWIAVSKYDFHDGLIYVDPSSRHITETKRLWAMGNYSQFVRPGDVRVSAHDCGGALEVVAFRSAARGEICAVVTNPLPEPVPARLSLVSMPAARAMTAYETSDLRDLERIYEGPESDAFQIAPCSVTTPIVDCS